MIEPGVVTPNDHPEVLAHRAAEDAIPVGADEQVSEVAVERHRLHRPQPILQLQRRLLFEHARRFPRDDVSVVDAGRQENAVAEQDDAGDAAAVSLELVALEKLALKWSSSCFYQSRHKLVLVSRNLRSVPENYLWTS